MTEYKFILFYACFIGFLFFMSSINAPIFSVQGIAVPPEPPDEWYKFPFYIFQMFWYMFKLITIPEVPTELKVLTSVVFLPFVVLLAWIIVKWVGNIVAQAIPF